MTNDSQLPLLIDSVAIEMPTPPEPAPAPLAQDPPPDTPSAPCRDHYGGYSAYREFERRELSREAVLAILSHPLVVVYLFCSTLLLCITATFSVMAFVQVMMMKDTVCATPFGL